jgi:SpoVK/Ycf46/Vps4 family AAA+-type ATPase
MEEIEDILTGLREDLEELRERRDAYEAKYNKRSLLVRGMICQADITRRDLEKALVTIKARNDEQF